MSVNLGENKISDVFKLEQGSAGGTNDYNELENKPQINGVTLQGNKTSADLGIVTGPTDVYTKQETNTLVDTKIAEAGATKADTSYVNEQLNLKADKSAVDLALASKANVDDVYTKDETVSTINSAITGKADTSYVNEQLNLKADKSTTYTKTEVDNSISSITQNINNKLANKADKSDTYTKEETISAIQSNTTNKADITYVDAQLNLKADKSDTYSKEEIDEKLDNPTITGDTLPIGSVVEWTGTQTPQNWLLCDGREVSRTTYSELFAAIGTVWGAGDGSTSFNIPDYRDKFVLGAGGDVDLAETGGEKAVKLSTNHIPPHNHTVRANIQNDSGNDILVIKNKAYYSSGVEINTSTTGGGQAHNNMPPYVGSYYIIKAKQSAGVIATVIDTLESSSTTDALSAKQGKILNDKTVTFEKTTNGFNLKFANGFMIQKKKVTSINVNCTTSAGDNGLFYGNYDMGNWDTPFTELFDFTYTIGKVYGACQPWLSSNTWSGSTENDPDNTWCGTLSMYLNWSSSVRCDLTCTGFGMWK